MWRWILRFSWLVVKNCFPASQNISQKRVAVLEIVTYHTNRTTDTCIPRSNCTKNNLSMAILRWSGPPNPLQYNCQSSKVSKSIIQGYAKQIASLPKYQEQELADKFRDGDFAISILFFSCTCRIEPNWALRDHVSNQSYPDQLFLFIWQNSHEIRTYYEKNNPRFVSKILRSCY